MFKLTGLKRRPKGICKDRIVGTEEFILAKQLGATINLDDITHIEFLKECAGIPEKISCRYNPGGVFALGTDIMDNPGDAKYG